MRKAITLTILGIFLLGVGGLLIGSQENNVDSHSSPTPSYPQECVQRYETSGVVYCPENGGEKFVIEEENYNG